MLLLFARPLPCPPHPSAASKAYAFVPAGYCYREGLLNTVHEVIQSNVQGSGCGWGHHSPLYQQLLSCEGTPIKAPVGLVPSRHDGALHRHACTPAASISKPRQIRREKGRGRARRGEGWVMCGRRSNEEVEGWQVIKHVQWKRAIGHVKGQEHQSAGSRAGV